MTTKTTISESSSPLSPSQHEQVAEAQQRAKKILKAASVAKFNGWTIGILAACSIPFSMFSLQGFVITIGMTIVAHNEFRGSQRLLNFEGDAAAFLGRNQVGFLALIIFYSLWMLSIGLNSENPITAELKANPELATALGSADDFEQYYRVVVIAFYATVIVMSLIFQGLNALYYFTRQKHLNDYLQATPSWVLDLQRLSAPTS